MSRVVVVGGGSAGAVAAARLAEDDGRDVVLVEAGPDDTTSPQLRDGTAPTLDFDWGYASEAGQALPRAKVIGGCSATNATFALRGSPTDYDEWPGWSWEDVLPHFCAVERDHDFHDEWHGRDGPLPIRRAPREELPEYQQAALVAANAHGHASVDDHNAPGACGAGPTPRNIGPTGERISTARAFLPAVREQTNFRLVSDATVDRVALHGSRATGIVLANGETIDAEEIVLAAGSYGTPAILMRSGIGPAVDLRAHEIDVVVDLPVGENLIEHPAFSVDVPARAVPDAAWFQSVVTYRSDWAGSDPYDMHLVPTGAVGIGPDTYVFFWFIGVMRPRGRGRLTLRSADPNDAPRIALPGLREPDDLARMLDAVARARALLQEPPLRDLVAGAEIKPGPDVQSPGELEAFVVRETAVYHHPVGTCAMGSVVDQFGRVIGIDGLRVADASIMPSIPAANTNLPAIMIAERIAAMMRA